MEQKKIWLSTKTRGKVRLLNTVYDSAEKKIKVLVKSKGGAIFLLDYEELEDKVKKPKEEDTEHFDIWAEGYRATGQSSGATYLGSEKAETFRQACKKHARKDSQFNYYFNEESMTYWGCKLFDNERDARKSFG